MHSIIAFVGPSGSGKTSLMRAMIEEMPDKVAMCMSVTTRQPRGNADDDAQYRFETTANFELRIKNGEFIHYVTHAGNYYGTLRADADGVLATKCALGAFVEQGVKNLRASGYTVHVVKIRPVGKYTANDPSRAAEDVARSAVDVQPEIVLDNDFSPGGWERTTAELCGKLAPYDS